MPKSSGDVPERWRRGSMRGLASTDTLRAGNPLRKEVERGPEVEKPIVIMFRELAERPEMKQKGNIESRTFRAAPEEGAWERAASEWLPSSQAPPVRVTQLLNTIPTQIQNGMSYRKQRKKASTRREGFTASSLPAGPSMIGISTRRNPL